MSDNDSGDSGKTLEITDEFAKAKRNVMFWCVLCYVAALSQLLPSDGGKGTVRLLYLDVQYPHWAIQLGCLSIATYMLVGYLRAEGRMRRLNSSLSRDYDRGETRIQLRSILASLEAIDKKAADAKARTENVMKAVGGPQNLRNNYIHPALDKIEMTKLRVRQELDEVLRKPSRGLAIINGEIDGIVGEVQGAVERWESDFRNLSDRKIELNSSVSTYGPSIDELNERLAKLQDYFTDIDQLEVDWHNQFDRQLVRFAFGAAALLVACAIIWFPHGPGEVALDPLATIVIENG